MSSLNSFHALCLDDTTEGKGISIRKEKSSKFISESVPFVRNKENAKTPFNSVDISHLDKEKKGHCGSEVSDDSDIGEIPSSPSFPHSMNIGKQPLKSPFYFHCPFMNCSLTVPLTHPKSLLEHFKNEHKIIIYNPNSIMVFIDRYLMAWSNKLNPISIQNWETKVDSIIENGKSYWVLGGYNNSEDAEIRRKLQSEALNEVLLKQEEERLHSSRLPRRCLFCKALPANRALLFQHMFSEHSFNIGLSDNLVNVDEFLQVLQTKLEHDQCLYCEKVFKSGSILRKHMRKKKHFKISPHNHLFDKYYVINYLESGKNWETLQKEDTDEETDNEEWDDWNEELSSETTCLFDEMAFPSVQETLNHMKKEHKFDLLKICHNLGLNFYGYVKFVNYIRRHTSDYSCFNCKEVFDTVPALVEHFKDSNHIVKMNFDEKQFPWDSTQYLFPTIESDPLICAVDELFDSDEEQDEK